MWTSTQYLSGGNVTCQTVTCYSEFVSALSVGLVSLCPSLSGLNYFDIAALKCLNSLQFSGFHLSHVGIYRMFHLSHVPSIACWRRRCPTRSARRFSGSKQGSASSSLGAACLTVYRVLRNCQKRDQLPWGILQDWIRLRPARDRSTSAIFPFNCPTAPSARFWSPSGFYLHSLKASSDPFLYSGEEEEVKLVQSVYWRNGFRSFVCKVPGGGGVGKVGWFCCLLAGA